MPPHAPPSPAADLAPPVTTLAGLQRLQHALADLVVPVPQRVALPLSRALGRVLADPPAGGEGLAAGLRIEPRHLAQFAATRQATVQVFGRPRVGIVALHGGPARTPRSATTAAMLAGAVEQLGAQAFQAACTQGGATALLRSVRMLAAECELVVVAGFVGAPDAAALLHGFDGHGLTCAFAPARVPRLGTLQLARLDGRLAIALSSDPGRAAASFATLVAPVVRRLQGRSRVVPPVLRACLADADEAGWPLLCREEADEAGLRPRLRACGGPASAEALAMADGVAWRPPDFDGAPRGAVAYFPLRTAFA